MIKELFLKVNGQTITELKDWLIVWEKSTDVWCGGNKYEEERLYLVDGMVRNLPIVVRNGEAWLEGNENIKIELKIEREPYDEIG